MVQTTPDTALKRCILGLTRKRLCSSFTTLDTVHQVEIVGGATLWYAVCISRSSHPAATYEHFSMAVSCNDDHNFINTVLRIGSNNSFHNRHTHIKKQKDIITPKYTFYSRGIKWSMFGTTLCLGLLCKFAVSAREETQPHMYQSGLGNYACWTVEWKRCRLYMITFKYFSIR
jgi:hypothetical protein